MLEACVGDKQSVSISEVQQSLTIFTSRTKPKAAKKNLFGTLAILGVVFKSKKLSERVASQLPSDTFYAPVGTYDRFKLVRTILGSVADTLITVGVTGVFVTLLGWIASCWSPGGAFLNIIALLFLVVFFARS
nr:unnamed protein product [Spirometra erinaceieuropaei]